ncbi:hypothetical protein DSCA_12410 [Desulfosarcina alkanivorans]|uniref:Uncharacterized protein n=1 Tax=Desulfosarcina alkanivorans TaxID=571177 RepID=A0A5K7YKH2_9BACT|nr:hypothetical protein DSCA_12410 [Desulfosarcina alkanivorans]
MKSVLDLSGEARKKRPLCVLCDSVKNTFFYLARYARGHRDAEGLISEWEIKKKQDSIRFRSFRA